MMNKRLYRLGLCLLSGMLFYLGWPMMPFFPVLMVAFVPLLLVEQEISKSSGKASNRMVLGYSYFSFLIWNILTTWWVWNSSPEGAVTAIVINPFLMSVPFVLFHFTKRRLGRNIGYLSFILYWLGFEWVHQTWEFTWPWLTLGNGLAKFPWVVQWYEFTGTSGGSLWILLLNLLSLKLLNRWSERSAEKEKSWKLALVSGLALFFIPLGISLAMYVTYETQSIADPVEIVVVQPNIDPHLEKFPGSPDFIKYQDQLDSLLNISERYVTDSTVFLVWPETSVPGGTVLNDLRGNNRWQQVMQLRQKYRNLTLVTGVSAYYHYSEGEKMSPTARKYGNGNCCFDAYNSAIQLNRVDEVTIHHKSKLVPGVERMPYPSIFQFLEAFALDLGGISGSLGAQEERTVFLNHDSIVTAPVVCYESVFGEYCTEYIHKGAELIFIVTNDGWWGNSPGHRQHLVYGALRAIETRRDIARSANTGISAFINQRGDIVEMLGYDLPGALRAEVSLNDGITFYVRFGDYISRTAGLLAIVLLLYSLIGVLTRKRWGKI